MKCDGMVGNEPLCMPLDGFHSSCDAINWGYLRPCEEYFGVDAKPTAMGYREKYQKYGGYF